MFKIVKILTGVNQSNDYASGSKNGASKFSSAAFAERRASEKESGQSEGPFLISAVLPINDTDRFAKSKNIKDCTSATVTAALCKKNEKILAFMGSVSSLL